MKRYLSKRPSPLLLTFAAFVVVTLVAIGGEISYAEQVIFETTYKLTAPIRQLLLLITQLGGPSMLLISAVVAFAAKRGRLALQLLVAGGFAFAVTMVFKALIARPRPFELWETVSQHDLLASGFGYPSGHTAIAVALAAILYPVFPKRSRWVLIVLAVLVGLSRISLGVHSPLDVVGGALLGLFAALLVRTEFPLAKNKS